MKAANSASIALVARRLKKFRNKPHSMNHIVRLFARAAKVLVHMSESQLRWVIKFSEAWKAHGDLTTKQSRALLRMIYAAELQDVRSKVLFCLYCGSTCRWSRRLNKHYCFYCVSTADLTDINPNVQEDFV